MKIYLKMFDIIWGFFLMAQILSYGAYPIIINLSKVDGKIQYSTTSMNFLVELFKLLFSVGCYLVLKLKYNRNTDNFAHDLELQQREKENLRFSLKTSVYYLIPAFLYFINNNLVVYMLHEMDSATFQVLGNLKILTTAVLFYFIMGKALSRLKWFSLFLLFIAGIFYVFGNLKSKVGENTESLDKILGEMFITKLGIVMIIAYSFISGFSGVYSEYLLKVNFANTIHTQNIYLYSFGTIFNLITAYTSSESSMDSSIFSLTIFNKFNFFTWFVIFTQVFTGFAMSIVMKHASNITRLFIISSSLIVTTILSVMYFNLQLNFYFFGAFSAIMIAIYFYLKN
jgi:probable UDP-sugar transporter A4